MAIETNILQTPVFMWFKKVTILNIEQISIMFINDKSPIINTICNNLVASSINILFCSESIKEELSQLSALKKLPQVCIIDLDLSL